MHVLAKHASSKHPIKGSIRNDPTTKYQEQKHQARQETQRFLSFQLALLLLQVSLPLGASPVMNPQATFTHEETYALNLSLVNKTQKIKSAPSLCIDMMGFMLKIKI